MPADHMLLSDGAGQFQVIGRGRSDFILRRGPTFIQSLLGELLMHNAGSSEATYACTALMLGLLDVLASKGILTRSDLNTIMVDAIGKLEPMRTDGSMAEAIELIKSLFPQIHGLD